MTEFSETLLENKEIIFKNGVKNVQAVGYNGTQTVPNTYTGGPPLTRKSLTWFPLPRFLAYSRVHISYVNPTNPRTNP